jgi:hypothetical protein
MKSDREGPDQGYTSFALVTGHGVFFIVDRRRFVHHVCFAVAKLKIR